MWINIRCLQLLKKHEELSLRFFHILCFFTCYIQYVDNSLQRGTAKWGRRRSIAIGVYLILLLLTSHSPSNASDPFPRLYISAELDKQILAAEALVMERRYAEARAVFDEMESDQPESALPSLGRLLILLAHSLEEGAPAAELEKGFASEFQKNQKAVRALESQETLDAWDHFLLGGAYGVRGLYEMERRRYLSAFVRGFKALRHFKEVQRLDPEIHDVYFATGIYKYFRSVKTRYFWFLPLIADQREEGLAEVRLALSRGHYAVPASKIALVVLAEKEGQLDEGARLAEQYLLEYPRCRLIQDALEKIRRRAATPAGDARIPGGVVRSLFLDFEESVDYKKVQFYPIHPIPIP